MTEKVLLIIVENLKYFLNILLGHEIKVLTNHKNITCETIGSVSQHVQLWNSLIQESGVTIIYIKGEDNVVVNSFHPDSHGTTRPKNSRYNSGRKHLGTSVSGIVIHFF